MGGCCAFCIQQVLHFSFCFYIYIWGEVCIMGLIVNLRFEI